MRIKKKKKNGNMQKEKKTFRNLYNMPAKTFCINIYTQC